MSRSQSEDVVDELLVDDVFVDELLEDVLDEEVSEVDPFAESLELLDEVGVLLSLPA